ncbi:hypothetical protein B0J12DRAFT_773309 [Macrophomina phaseolina]|uniref:Uncharacterized protein n=1 Tax=Macrophomina phaseolina TaxID=35725 RepID=A0ABQ8FT29_9PEZI|nr:hypothetical protein B0J12DRAFT_705903 [Macrophomina phaseolina]KAH7025348.1 hypothetical protein B0J12DRAFT_773309 [Macrophomina phaseolina]
MYSYQRPSEGAYRPNRNYPFSLSAQQPHIATPAQKLLSRSRDRFSSSSQPRSQEYSMPVGIISANGGRTGGFQTTYLGPGPQEISLDAISRLKAQTQYNTAALEVQRKSLDDLTQAVDRLSNDIKRLDKQVITKGGILPTAGSSPNSAPPLPLGSPVTFLQERSQSHPTYQMQHTSHHGHAPPSHLPYYPISSVQNSTRTSPQVSWLRTPKSQPSEQNQYNDSASVSVSTNRWDFNSADQHMDSYPGNLGPPKTLQPTSLYSPIGIEPVTIMTPVRHIQGEIDGRGDHVKPVSVQEQQQGLTLTSAASVQSGSAKQPHCGPSRRSECSNFPEPISQESRYSEGSDRGRRGQSLPTDFREFEKAERKINKNHLQMTLKYNDNGDPRGDSTTRRGPGNTGPITRKSHIESRKASGKQMRNANGILLRKDGMPDMRSRRKKKGVLQNLLSGIVHDSVAEVENRRCNASVE